MKHKINHSLYVMSAVFLISLLYTINLSLNLQPQSMVHATSQQEQEADQQEDLQTPSENKEVETNAESINSEHTKDNDEDENKNDNNNDSVLDDQNNSCPDISDYNVPTFIDEDGCIYPCSITDNNDKDIPQDCPSGTSPKSSSSFSINEEIPIQSQQPQQQSMAEQPQQDVQTTTTNQNTVTNPRVNSDTTATIANSIPNTEITTTQKSYNFDDPYKPGSGISGLNIPNSLYDPTGSYNPGGGNTDLDSSSVIPNTNPVTPVEPGNIPSKIEDRLAYLTVYSNSTTTKPVEICVFISHPYEVKGNPHCIEASSSGTIHALQAPGLIGIRHSNNVDQVDTSSCEFHIYPKQIKSCVLNINDNPFTKSKSETTEQDRSLSFNR